MSTGAKTSLDCIGREPHLAALVARRREAARGRASTVLVCGDAGCGKTRLLEAFAETLTHGRGEVVWIRAAEVAKASRAITRLRTNASGAARPMKRTTVVFVEDAHAAPPDLLDAVGELAAAEGRLRRLIVVTFRPSDVENDSARLIALAKLARTTRAVTVEIEPLDRNETSVLVRALASERCGLAPASIDAIVERSGGNPLVARELVAHYTADPESAHSPRKLPLSLNGLASEWLAPFSEEDRTVLSHAALLRDGFRIRDVADLIGEAPASVSPVLRRALSRRIVAERSGDPEAYFFRHPIVADFLETRFLEHEKRALHVRIAQRLETAGLADERAPDLARHWLEAGHDDLASVYADRSGDRAFAEARYGDAARWYERAAASSRAADIHAPHVFVKLARALDRAGNAPGTHEALRTAALRLETAGDTHGALRLRLDDALIAQHEANLPAGLSRLESVTRFGMPASSRAYAQAVAAFLLALRQETDRALDLLANFPRDDAATDRAALQKYWEVLAFVAVQHCDPNRFDEAAARCLDAARRAGDPAIATAAESDIAISTLHFAEQATDALFERAIAMSREHRLSWIESYTRAFAAVNDFVRGRLESGRQHVREMLPIATDMPMIVVARTYAGISIARALCDDELLAACSRAEFADLAFGTGVPSVFGRAIGPYAEHLAERGHLDEARALLGRCVGGLRGAYGTFLTMPAVAAHAEERDVATARRILSGAARNGADRIAAATLALFDALWKERTGAIEAAREDARTAAMRYRAIGWTGMEARAADVAGDRIEALRLYRQCGNVREVRRLELASAIPAHASPAAAEGALSPRERRIVELVASGRSNRAISVELALSEKTVERHLTVVFKKLGFRSRTELAASAARYAAARPNAMVPT